MKKHQKFIRNLLVFSLSPSLFTHLLYFICRTADISLFAFFFLVRCRPSVARPLMHALHQVPAGPVGLIAAQCNHSNVTNRMFLATFFFFSHSFTLCVYPLFCYQSFETISHFDWWRNSNHYDYELNCTRRQLHCI